MHLYSNSSGYHFEKVCAEALTKQGYLQLNPDINTYDYRDTGYDYLFEDSDGYKLAIEIKFISRFKNHVLHKAIDRFISMKCTIQDIKIDKFVIITSCPVSSEEKNRLLNKYKFSIKIEIWDYHDIVSNLLLSNENNDLVIKINDIIKASIPFPPSDDHQYLLYPLDSSNHFDEIIKLLGNIKIDGTGSKYEEACIKAINLLFEKKNFSTSLIAQKETKLGIHKFDAIVRISSNASSFWKTISYFFNCLYVIFEFKNYKEEISQKEIYSTEKYLYKNSLRTVAIMVVRSGYNKNVPEVVRGALREHGKIIIILKHDELLGLLESSKDNPEYDPSTFLEEKLDNLLMTIDR